MSEFIVPSRIRRKLLTLGLSILLFDLKAQVALSVAGHVGSPVTNGNLLPANLAYGAGFGFSCYLDENVNLVASVSSLRLKPENEYLDKYQILQINLGFGFDILKEKQKLQLQLTGLLSESQISVDQNSLPDFFSYVSDSRWTQWGYAGELQYFPKKYWGVSLGYTRYCARRYDVLNFQDIVKAGVIFRLERVKLNEESK